jgi:hypothetical protein
MDPDPDPGGPKTCGSGFGSGSATLTAGNRRYRIIHITFAFNFFDEYFESVVSAAGEWVQDGVSTRLSQ